jgi:LacI family transcriptional regulator
MVNMRDVAARAGVSVATVSNFLNSPEIVTEATREKVSAAIVATGYAPNEAARQLRSGRSRMVAFVALELDNAYVSAVIAGLEQRAAEHGLFVSIICTNGDLAREARYLRMLLQQRVYGVLLASGHTRGEELDLLLSKGVPTVLIDDPASDGDFPSVTVDDETGGRLAAAHLLETGARRICFVGDPSATFQVADRLRGSREVIAEAPGTQLEVIPAAERTIGAGLQVGMSLTERRPSERPDAVFAANDSLAIGILEALRRDPGLRVPEDIRVMGYDDNPLAASEAISLSTIRRPREELGGMALDLLRERSEAPNAARPRRIVIEPELVVRKTTRSPD